MSILTNETKNPHKHCDEPATRHETPAVSSPRRSVQYNWEEEEGPDRQSKRPRSTKWHTDHTSRSRSEVDHSNNTRSPSFLEASPSSNKCYTSALPRHNAAAILVEGGGKKYERRPRRKTKSDKYELKVDKKRKDMSGAEKSRRKSKRRRRKKTGVTLNHEFKAPNVQQDRLTLKSNTGPGIFHKGKASVPVERRGLPDLTFSEMTFLTKRRELDDARYQRLKDKQPKKTKSDKGSAKEVSGLFSKPEEHDPGLPAELDSASGQWKVFSKPSASLSPNKSSPVRVGSRKPLSVICGTGSMPRVFSTHIRSGGALERGWVSDHDNPGVQHLERVERLSFERTQPGSATSYYSLSVTPSRRFSGLSGVRVASDVQHVSTGDPVLESQPTCAFPRDVIHHAGEVPERSSISNRSLDKYTKHILLGEDKRGFWSRVPRVSSRNECYTLDDLKRLARLSELDTAVRDPNETIDQHHSTKRLDRNDRPFDNLDRHQQSRPDGSSVCPGTRNRFGKVTTWNNEIRVLGKSRTEHAGGDSPQSKREIAHSACQGFSANRPNSRPVSTDRFLLPDVRLSPGRIAWLLETDVPTSKAFHYDGFGAMSARSDKTRRPRVPLWQVSETTEEQSLLRNTARTRTPAQVQGRYRCSQERQSDIIDNLYSDLSFGPSLELRGNQASEALADPDIHLHESYGDKKEISLSDGHDDFDRNLLYDDMQGSHTNFPDPEFEDTGLGQQESRIIEARFGMFAHLREHAQQYHLSRAPELEVDSTQVDPHQIREELRNDDSCEQVSWRNENWIQAHGQSRGFAEEQEQFMGFARPHTLY